MTWEDILKMPVPIDTGAKRDEEYKQKIIQWEKTVVEPELTQWHSDDTVQTGFNVVFKHGSNDFFDTSGVYYIGSQTIKDLGGRFTYILEVLEEIYSQEGYKTSLTEGQSLSVTGN